MGRLNEAFSLGVEYLSNSKDVATRYSSDEQRIIASQRLEEIDEEYCDLTRGEKFMFHLGRGLIGAFD